MAAGASRNAAQVGVPGAEDALQQRAQVVVLHRRDELAQVLLHLLGGDPRAVQQIVEHVLALARPPQRLDLQLAVRHTAAHAHARAGLARARELRRQRRRQAAGAVGQHDPLRRALAYQQHEIHVLAVDELAHVHGSGNPREGGGRDRHAADAPTLRVFAPSADYRGW